MKNNWKDTIKFGLGLLNKKDRKKYYILVSILTLLSIVDLIAIFILGTVSYLAISGLGLAPKSNKIISLLDMIGLSATSFQNQVLILAIIGVFMFMCKTFLSNFLFKKFLMFLATRSSITSKHLITKYFNRPAYKVIHSEKNNAIFALSEGVDSLIIKGLTYYATLFTDLFLIFITTIALLIIDPYFTIFIFIYFILVGLILFKIQQSVSRKYGLTLSKIRLDFSDKIYEYHDNYREITLRGSKNIYNEELNKFREIQSITSAKSAFLQIQSKYIFESSIIFGAISFSLLQFLLKDIGHATVSLALFITAATRIAPTLLRLQNTLTQISGISGFSNSTIDLANLVVNEIIEPKLNESKKSLNLRLENVHFQYPENSAFALQDINLEIIHNSFTAIVGPTGSGKSTLLDLCLGFLTPSKGNIQLFGQLPNLFSVENPGKISIIPQRINITKGTIRDNISLGFFNIGTDEEFLWEVLKKVKLDDYIFNMPNKLDSTIGEFGSKISGGQRQRLAIARALYTSPIIIGFDEATSSLDAETEQSISEMLLLLRGNCTIITVAHRLSSIKNADSVIYMERGKILATGNFEEVKNSVPNFRTQANLMGL